MFPTRLALQLAPFLGSVTGLGSEGEGSSVCIDFDLVIWFIKKFQIEPC